MKSEAIRFSTIDMVIMIFRNNSYSSPRPKSKIPIDGATSWFYLLANLFLEIPIQIVNELTQLKEKSRTLDTIEMA